METKFKIIALLAFFTEIAPEQRMCQILENAKKYCSGHNCSKDWYYIEDLELLKMLEEYKTYCQEISEAQTKQVTNCL